MKSSPALKQSTEPTPDQRQVNGNCLSVGEVIRLNLGGRDTAISGFKTVDLKAGPTVDYVCDISDLRMFEDNSVDEIYASHCLEHFSHTRTVYVLEEWRRVLKPKARCAISVPDFNAAIELYKAMGLTDFVRNLLYGDQGYDLAYHYVTFTFATLAKVAIEAGFSDVQRLTQMPYSCEDCSMLLDTVTHRPISIHVACIK